MKYRSPLGALGVGSIGVLGCLGIVALFACLLGIGPAIFMALWNWLMPAIFGLPKITFWMSFGLILLISFLTGGLRVRVQKS